MTEKQDHGSKCNAEMSNGHEYYAELCALATSGTLTDREWSELNAHVAQCGNCRVRVQQYREIARTGMALLMPERPGENSAVTQPAWSAEDAKRELFRRIARGEDIEHSRRSTGPKQRPARVPWWRSLLQPVPQHILGYAAGLLVVVALTASAYRFGASHNSGNNISTDTAEISTQLSRLLQERTALKTSVDRRTHALDDLRQQLQRRSAELAKWKALDEKLSAELDRKNASWNDLQASYSTTMAERDMASHNLQGAKAALQALQQKYDSLRAQQESELLDAADLESRVGELSGALQGAQTTIRQQQEFLASDRDIRELMGARNLYIADVYDINRKGETQKPYGRVFYTSGKSLIFYAFDLDRQAKVRDTSIFQLWGRRGGTDTRPLNMGIFYLDSAANKRWVLKFDDPKVLAEIDAVFVTVEPHPGRHKPSGKELLFASLRNVATNHP